MDKINTVQLCDLPSDPILLMKELDKLTKDGKYVQVNDIVYSDVPRSIKFLSSERENYILDCYLQELEAIPRMDYDKINSIFRSGSSSERLAARDSALHIVPKIAELYISPVNMDVIQSGNEELLDAVEEYNPSICDFDFTPYAAIRIRHGILSYIMSQSNMRNADKQIASASDAAAEKYRQYLSENGIPPTAEELAEIAEIDIGFAHIICEQLNN